MTIERFILGDIRSNCYIISENGHAIVVDPGFDSDKVKAYLTTNDLTIDVIYATHGHFDHIGGINALKGLYQMRLLSHHSMTVFSSIIPKAYPDYPIPCMLIIMSNRMKPIA